MLNKCNVFIALYCITLCFVYNLFCVLFNKYIVLYYYYYQIDALYPASETLRNQIQGGTSPMEAFRLAVQVQ